LSSVGQFFEFLKNHQFGFFKYSRTKQLLVSLLFTQFPNQRTTGHGYFEKPQGTGSFHEKTGDSLAGSWTLSDL
jgi:hypothetical protein